MSSLRIEFHSTGPITTVRSGLVRRIAASASRRYSFQSSAVSLPCGSLRTSKSTSAGLFLYRSASSVQMARNRAFRPAGSRDMASNSWKSRMTMS